MPPWQDGPGAGCSEGHKTLGTKGSSSQTSGGYGTQQVCGIAILDPVPDLNCASLNISAPAASVDALPGGYWTGRFADETRAVQGYMQALVSEDGRFQIQAYRYNATNLCTNWEAELTGKSRGRWRNETA